jgi:hypothetical protein
MWFNVSFKARYVSLTSMVKTRLPTQTKKCHIFVNISQKMFYFNYLLQFPKNPQICFFREKIP